MYRVGMEGCCFFRAVAVKFEEKDKQIPLTVTATFKYGGQRPHLGCIAHFKSNRCTNRCTEFSSGDR